MTLALALLSAAAWVYLAAFYGRFWQLAPMLPAPALPAAQPQPIAVAVVIPARDEAEHIQATLRSLLSQHVPGSLSVILIDDNSTDGTGDLARAVATVDARLHVLSGAPLPPGWTGKLWAVSQGLKHPAAQAAGFILLTDADIFHQPGHLAQLLTHAQSTACDLVSEMVLLRVETFAERATIPAFVFFFCMLYPFRWVSNPRRRTAGAAGGTMLLSRAALDRIDGVHRIRAELIDDCSLAREVKRGGHRIWLGHATQARSERRYQGFAEVWNMVARTAYVQLGYSPLLLLGTALGMLLLYLAPVLAALFAGGWTRWLGLGTWVLMALLFQPVLRRYRLHSAWGLALPLIAFFYVSATLGSAWRFYRGQGGQWKRRTYPDV